MQKEGPEEAQLVSKFSVLFHTAFGSQQKSTSCYFYDFYALAVTYLFSGWIERFWEHPIALLCTSLPDGNI